MEALDQTVERAAAGEHERPLLGGADKAELHLYDREEWKLACRIATSKGMAKSELLPRFLLHICQMSLRGREDEITEQRIGMLIFNRPAGYNPGEDNIVRSYARTLRKRLEDYFAQEGSGERMRVTIPRGGYVPVFEAMAPSANTSPHQTGVPHLPQPLLLKEDAEVYLPESKPAFVAQLGSRPFIWMVALMGMLIGTMLAFTIWFAWTAHGSDDTASAALPLWSQLFQSNRETLIVPADSGLGILENLSGRSITVEQYANGSYLNELATGRIDSGNFTDIGRQRYTSVVDVNIVARLSGLPNYRLGRTQIRYARSMTADDFKSSNAILIGSKHTDPWVALFDHSMEFSLEYTSAVDESFIVNRSPKIGEQKIYRNSAAGTSGPTYGVIAYLPSLDGSGNVLILQGLNMAGTEASAEALFNPRLIQPALKLATAKDGSLRPFEFLIETSSVGATSPQAHILATRIHTN